MEKIKLSKSIKKYIRSEKNRIRKEFLDVVRREKALGESLKKVGLFVNEKKQLKKIEKAEKIEKPKKDKIKKKVDTKKNEKKVVKKDIEKPVKKEVKKSTKK